MAQLGRDMTRQPLRIGLGVVVTAFRMRQQFSLLLGILYVLSPVDFIPEAVLGVVGLLDDLAVLLFVLVLVAGLYRAMVMARARAGP